MGTCLLFYTNLNICTKGVEVVGNEKEHLKLISYLQVKELSNDQEERFRRVEVVVSLQKLNLVNLKRDIDVNIENKCI